jgi:hypothetical protein
MNQGPDVQKLQRAVEARQAPQRLPLLAMARGGRAGAWATALGGLTAAVCFGFYSGCTTEARHGFWKEVVGASLCFGIPLFSFGWVIGYGGGAIGGLFGGVCVAKANLGRGGVLLGAVLAGLVAGGVEWLLIPARLFEWHRDWFLFLAAGWMPLGSAFGGYVGALRALRKAAVTGLFG